MLDPAEPDNNEHRYDNDNERQKGRVTRGYEIKCITTKAKKTRAGGKKKKKKKTGKKQ